MDSIVCNSKEDAVKMLQAAKEYFQVHVDSKEAPSVVASHLSMIDAVQLFIDPKFDLNK